MQAVQYNEKQAEFKNDLLKLEMEWGLARLATLNKD